MTPEQQPVIGLCAAYERAQWAVWDQPAFLLPANYVESVQRAGGTAILLPLDPAAVEEPARVLDLVDGLLLAGGADIDPSFYGRTAEPGLEATVPERDAFELALARAALDRNQPLLGICRGMQVINVALGGTLHQDIGNAGHREVLGSFDGADHHVELEPGSLAAVAAGGTTAETKSHHHQAVDSLGTGLSVTGRYLPDGTCEAIELTANDFALGVQWHPEATPRDTVIAAFVAAAAEWRRCRG